MSVSFIPSVVSGKLAINTVEFNSRKVSCFHLSIYCLSRTTFHYAMREWAEFFIFDVRTDSCLCTGSPGSQQHTGSQIIRICMEIYLKIGKTVKMYKKRLKRLKCTKCTNVKSSETVVFICPFIVFLEPLFTMQCVNGQSFLYSMFGLTHVYAQGAQDHNSILEAKL